MNTYIIIIIILLLIRLSVRVNGEPIWHRRLVEVTKTGLLGCYRRVYYNVVPSCTINNIVFPPHIGVVLVILETRRKYYYFTHVFRVTRGVSDRINVVDRQKRKKKYSNRHNNAHNNISIITSVTFTHYVCMYISYIMYTVRIKYVIITLLLSLLLLLLSCTYTRPHHQVLRLTNNTYAQWTWNRPRLCAFACKHRPKCIYCTAELAAKERKKDAGMIL